MILQPATGGGSGLVLQRMRWNKDLLGVRNGVNSVFTTPEVFVQDGELVIRVYKNGSRQRFGSSNDYTVSESGGAGSGYDTVTFNGPAPQSNDGLTADYFVP